MKTKTKKKIISFIFAAIISCAFFAKPILAAGPTQFNYPLLESFPGFYSEKESVTDLPGFILSMYKFGIWTVGIAGLFMLVVGGIMYMGSAGNNSTATSAKGIIWDSLIGIVAALAAYLFLYVINPDLTKISLNFTPVDVTEKPTPQSTGDCRGPVTLADSPCTVEALKQFAASKNDPKIDPQKWAEQASRICNAESGGFIGAESNGKCSGASIAYGLFQINLNTSGRCPGAYTAIWSSQRADKKLNDAGCSADPNVLQGCKSNVLNASANINRAWQMYIARGYSWADWEANKLWCKFPPNSANK